VQFYCFNGIIYQIESFCSDKIETLIGAFLPGLAYLFDVMSLSSIHWVIVVEIVMVVKR